MFSSFPPIHPALHTLKWVLLKSLLRLGRISFCPQQHQELSRILLHSQLQVGITKNEQTTLRKCLWLFLIFRPPFQRCTSSLAVTQYFFHLANLSLQDFLAQQFKGIQSLIWLIMVIAASTCLFLGLSGFFMGSLGCLLLPQIHWDNLILELLYVPTGFIFFF